MGNEQESKNGEASSSGQTDEQRAQDKKKDKAEKDAEMNVDKTPESEGSQKPEGESNSAAKGGSMDQDEEGLSEAPGQIKDRRFPLDPRKPAIKRGRDPGSPKGSAKFQAFEVESNKRSLEDGENPGAKWETVEIEDPNAGKSTDSVEKVSKDEVGMKTSKKEIRPRDLVGRDIGSVTMSRVFKNATYLQVSTRKRSASENRLGR